MSWAEVSKVNSDFMEIPLDVLMYLADYKMYGESSFVYQDKSKLYKVYEASNISMNDSKVNGEALDYLLKTQNAGEVLTLIHELGQKEQIRRSSTMTAIANDTTAMTAVLNSNTATAAIANSSTAMTAIANSTTAMTAVLNSSTATAAIANSSTAMTEVLESETAIGLIVAAQYVNIKPFILKINGNKEYIKKLFMLVLNNSRFKLLYNGNASSVVNAYENKQGIITFSCLGFSGSSGDNSGVSSRVYNNGELIKDAIDAGYTTNATPDKANAVTIGKTKWGYNSGRYNYANITCAVYEKIA